MNELAVDVADGRILQTTKPNPNAEDIDENIFLNWSGWEWMVASIVDHLYWKRYFYIYILPGGKDP